MFIEQAYRGHHEWWRYVIGTLIIVGLFVIGQLPLSLALILKGSSHLNSNGPLTTKDLMQAANLSPNTFTFLLLLSFVFGALGIYLVVKFIHKQSLKNFTTTRKRFDWKRFFLSFGLVAVFIIVSTLVDYFSNPDDFEIQFRLIPFLILFIMGIILVPIQAGFEEYLFRGYLMRGFGLMAKNRWAPLILTSVIFGSLHFSNPEVAQFGPSIMIFYIGTGFFLGGLTLMDEGMELSLGFHVANNLIQILLVTADWSAFQSESILRDLTDPSGIGGEIILSLLIFYPVLILIFARVYRWKDWTQKLFGRLHPEELSPTGKNH